MLSRIVTTAAVSIAAALVFLGTPLESKTVKVAPLATKKSTATMCVNINAQTYGYCCKLRFEPNCPAPGVNAASQSMQLKLSPLSSSRLDRRRMKLAEAPDHEDIGSDSATSVFVIGNTEDPGRGLGANNGGNNGSGGGAGGGGSNMGGGANNGGSPGNGGTAGNASDVRLKQNVRFLLSLPNGLKIYSFQYLWDRETYVGVMAQDLIQNRIFAPSVHRGEDGYYRVDYSALGLRMVALDEWASKGVNALYKR